ncbi:MAG: hypothetical protein HPZ81_04395 [Oscillospiraceae bacterium]|nr:hypothetical protein [Oscillospiraceae bacterium]
MSKWEKYEEEKKKLKKMGLSHSEYEKAIINLRKKIENLTSGGHEHDKHKGVFLHHREAFWNRERCRFPAP